MHYNQNEKMKWHRRNIIKRARGGGGDKLCTERQKLKL